jgi:integrase/recombinase XerD
MFPGTINGSRADKPITPKVLWEACREAAQRAGITKAARPHLLRHYAGFRTIPGELVFGPVGGSLANIFPA